MSLQNEINSIVQEMVSRIAQAFARANMTEVLELGRVRVPQASGSTSTLTTSGKRRGRPPGSKNKPKTVDSTPVLSVEELVRAEVAKLASNAPKVENDTEHRPAVNVPLPSVVKTKPKKTAKAKRSA